MVAEKPSHFGYDERSISEAALDPESKEAWAKPSQGLRRKLDSELLDAATVDASKVCQVSSQHTRQMAVGWQIRLVHSVVSLCRRRQALCITSARAVHSAV